MTDAGAIASPKVRRLPPLTTVFMAPSRGTTRRATPAHIGAEPPGSRPAGGVARVLPGSLAVSARYIWACRRSQPTPVVIRLTWAARRRPPGLLPRDLPSPINRYSAR